MSVSGGDDGERRRHLSSSLKGKAQECIDDFYPFVQANDYI
jgi:hypothetical protein